MSVSVQTVLAACTRVPENVVADVARLEYEVPRTLVHALFHLIARVAVLDHRIFVILQTQHTHLRERG